MSQRNILGRGPSRTQPPADTEGWFHQAFLTQSPHFTLRSSDDSRHSKGLPVAYWACPIMFEMFILHIYNATILMGTSLLLRKRDLDDTTTHAHSDRVHLM